MKDYEKALNVCKAIKSDLDRSNCVYGLLYDITKMQDRIQLNVPKMSGMQTIMGVVVGDANAIILEISKWKGADQAIRHLYLDEKVGLVVRDYNALIHDYNISHEKTVPSYKIERKEAPEPTDAETIKGQKEALYRGIKGTYVDKKWMLVKGD